MNFNRNWMQRFSWPHTAETHLPMAIAHRGASDYRTENTLPAFRLASELFAEMWEADIRLTSDGVAVVSHDDSLLRTFGLDLCISTSTWRQIRRAQRNDEERVPQLDEVVDLAKQLGAGLYLEAKSTGAAEEAWRILDEKQFRFAAIGSFVVDWIARLREDGCPYPLSVLVPAGVDPFERCAPAKPDVMHLCWLEASLAPQTLVTRKLVDRCQRNEMAMVLWHEDRREALDVLERLDVLGICSNRPECLKPSRSHSNGAPAIVCHRGANHLAPENTLEAARICIDQAFDWIELDVRTTADGHLVVVHDADVDRTTNGSGLVSEITLAELRQLDAGSWFSREFKHARVPLLKEMLEQAQGKASLYVEIKDANPERVVNEVAAAGMMDHAFFWCMYPETMRRMRSMSNEARLMAVRKRYPSLAAAANDYSADIIEFELGVDNLDEVGLCRDLGVQSMIYSLTDDLHELQSMFDSKPDLVNVDRPDLFKMVASYPHLMPDVRRLRSTRRSPARDAA